MLMESQNTLFLGVVMLQDRVGDLLISVQVDSFHKHVVLGLEALDFAKELFIAFFWDLAEHSRVVDQIQVSVHLIIIAINNLRNSISSISMTLFC